VFCAGLVFLAVNHGSLHLTFPTSLIAVSLSAVVDFLINTGLVSCIIGLCTSEKPIDVWNQHFAVTAPSYFYGAWFAAAMVGVLGSRTVAVVLGLAPVAYLTYRSFNTTAMREAERQKSREDLAQTERHISELYLSTIKSLALAIDAKDPYTHQHILRVQRYAMAIARQLKLHPTDMEGVNTGALLHDIGKIGVPEYVLLKPGRLTKDEYDKIKEHPEIGAAILDPVAFPWPVLPVVKYHHEKWDGTGYPEGLKGEQIPLTARVLAVADVYDALTSTRSYRGAWSHERAVDLIRREAGAHFDRDVVEAFLEVIQGVVEEMAEEGIGPLAKPPEIAETSRFEGGGKNAGTAQPDISSELFNLLQIERSLPAGLGTDAILNMLAGRLTALFPDSTCALLLKGEDGTLTVRATVGINREFFDQAHSRDASGPSAQVVRTFATYNGPYDPDDILFESKTEIRWTPLASALITVIAHQGEALGSINLYHTEEEAFNRLAEHAVEAVAAAAGSMLFESIALDRVAQEGEIDAVTGLYNLRYLVKHHTQSATALQTPSGRKPQGHVSPADQNATEPTELSGTAVLCLDIDDFKAVNEVCGRACGDVVLREVGLILRNCLEDEGLIARVGKDQFLIQLPGADFKAVIALGVRLEQCVAAHPWGRVDPVLAGIEIRVSIGAACSPADGDDLYSLYSVASRRMYRAKAERKLCRTNL
jgi:diguanylate cyclase (GGDEF)-like protein/putative nucleotidyltransferase with HDIG domain